MRNKLAIVLPAYKPEFLREALQSIANQDDKRFKLYIGDDNSPFGLAYIVREFEGRIDMTYHRFEQNLGSHDLVAHWKRCVDLIQDEEWIWLFSDDDIMDSNCVQAFYRHVEQDSNCDIVHFGASIIDHQGRLMKALTAFPSTLRVGDFFFEKITYRLSSFAIEYIFKRTVYEKVGGFVSFDLAWCSDDASWISFGQSAHIKTIPGATVKWRKSNLNITTWSNKAILFRKVDAQINFINWAIDFFRKNSIKERSSSFQKIRWILDLPFCSPVLTFSEKMELAKKALSATETEPSKMKIWSYLLYCEMKCRIKQVLLNK